MGQMPAVGKDDELRAGNELLPSRRMGGRQQRFNLPAPTGSAELRAKFTVWPVRFVWSAGKSDTGEPPRRPELCDDLDRQPWQSMALWWPRF